MPARADRVRRSGRHSSYRSRAPPLQGYQHLRRLFASVSRQMSVLTAQRPSLEHTPLHQAPTPTHAAAPNASQPESVRATIRYTHADPGGQELYQYVHLLPDGTRPSNLVADAKEVSVIDIRTTERRFSLHRNGFQFESLQVADDIDWRNETEVSLLRIAMGMSRFQRHHTRLGTALLRKSIECATHPNQTCNHMQVKQRYYPLAEELIKQVSGASDVLIFDHTLRQGRLTDDPSAGAGAKKDLVSLRTPAATAHVDYNLSSGRKRLYQLVPKAEADAWTQRPFAVIQVSNNTLLKTHLPFSSCKC